MAKRRYLKDEISFWSDRVETLKGLEEPQAISALGWIYADYGGPVGFMNHYLRGMIEDIESKQCSLEGVTVQDCQVFLKVLDCPLIDISIRNRLSQLLYGADERRMYFE